jgi:photosystem II stability/assembly factor-like uncharacterized protein
MPHRYSSVSAMQAYSPAFLSATVGRCTKRGSSTTCRPRLFVSQDRGRTWADVTPPEIPRGSVITAVTFLDTDHGWAVASDCADEEGNLYRTSDGGRSWVRRRVGGSTCNAGAGVFPVFGDPDVGYLTHLEPTGGFAEIARSRDGGRSWSRPRPMPVVGEVEFTSSSEGWLAAGFGAAELLHTLDRGRSWRRVQLPISRHAVRVGSPVFMGAEGVLPATIEYRRGWGVQFVATEGEDTWRRVGSIRFQGRAPARVDVTGIAGPNAWWVDVGHGDIVRSADGGTTWHRTSRPNHDQVVSIEPINGRRSWLITEHGHARELWLTKDGGRSWTRVKPSSRRRGPASAELHPVADLPGTAGEMAAAPDGSVYALFAGGGESFRVARFDPATGEIEHTTRTFRGPAFGANRLALAAGSLWFTRGQFSRRGLVVRLEADSLVFQERIRLPAPVVGLSATPTGIWIGTGRSVALLDPLTGVIKHKVPIGGHVTHLDADPAGLHLYVSTGTAIDDHDHVRFVELDARTGALLAVARDVGFADLFGPSGVIATDDGVWLTTPTGMMGTLSFRRASDLHELGFYRPGGTNGISASFAGSMLWVPNWSGGITCADPVTGAVRGFVGAPDQYLATSNVVATPSGLYVGGDGTAIDRIRADAECVA